jgi:hypothetical protein
VTLLQSGGLIPHVLSGLLSRSGAAAAGAA